MRIHGQEVQGVVQYPEKLFLVYSYEVTGGFGQEPPFQPFILATLTGAWRADVEDEKEELSFVMPIEGAGELAAFIINALQSMATGEEEDASPGSENGSGQ